MQLSPTVAFRLLIISMLGLSVYFTIDVQLRRAALQGSAAGLALDDGAVVAIDKPIDGDEMSVASGEQVLTVRLLGIKAFDVSNEPGLGDPGQRAIERLSRFNGASAKVRFEASDLDRTGRLLARLEVDGLDLGRDLVSEGWAVVYTKYPFPEMAAYLAVQAEAEAGARGLWGVPKAAERARKIIQGWESE